MSTTKKSTTGATTAKKAQIEQAAELARKAAEQAKQQEPTNEQPAPQEQPTPPDLLEGVPEEILEANKPKDTSIHRLAALDMDLINSGEVLPNIKYVATATFQELLDLEESEDLIIPDFQRSANAWSIEQKRQFAYCATQGRIMPSLAVCAVGGKLLLEDGNQRLHAVKEQVDALLEAGDNDRAEALQGVEVDVMLFKTDIKTAAQMFVDLNNGTALSMAQREKPKLNKEVLEVINTFTAFTNSADGKPKPWAGKKPENLANMLATAHIDATEAQSSISGVFKSLLAFKPDKAEKSGDPSEALRTFEDVARIVQNGMVSEKINYLNTPARQIPVYVLCRNFPGQAAAIAAWFMGTDFTSAKEKAECVTLTKKGSSRGQESAVAVWGDRTNGKKATYKRITWALKNFSKRFAAPSTGAQTSKEISDEEAENLKATEAALLALVSAGEVVSK